MSKVRVIDTPTLVRLNNEAIKTKRNRSLIEDIENHLDPYGIHVVFFSMIHNDREMRVGLLTKMKDQEKPVEVFLDMSFENYDALATVEIKDKV